MSIPVSKVVPTAAGALVPWSHHRLIEEIEANEPPCKCSSCGLRAGVSVLGFGVDGTVCFDCNKAAVDASVRRLRSYRA
jgi:hypothetical protein